MKRVGENCASCNRWVPSFARTCTVCGLPSSRVQVENLARFLSGEGALTRPAARISERYHGAERPRVVRPRAEPTASLTQRYSVKLIRERLAAGVRPSHVARELGVAPATIGRIQKRIEAAKGAGQ
jgi:hypothetical protein